jgi:hypothetical protein
MDKKFIIKFIPNFYLSTKGTMTENLNDAKLYNTQELAQSAMKNLRAPTEIVPVWSRTFVFIADKIKPRQKADLIKRNYENCANVQKELNIPVPLWEELSPESYAKLEKGITQIIKEFTFLLLLQL